MDNEQTSNPRGEPLRRFRHIDTAEGHKNEECVGKAIGEGAVAREDVFLTTKVSPESFGPGQIMRP